MMASTSLMVPEKHLARIQGLNQSLHGGRLIITAPLGALLYGALPMAGVMAVDVGTALIAIVPLLFIHVPQPGRSEPESPGGVAGTLGDVMAGFRYLRERSGQMTLLGMSAVINFCMLPAFSLLPLLVLEQQGGAMQLGWINSVFGVGTIVGGIALGVWGGFKRRIYTTFAGLIAVGLATFALGAAPTWTLALVAMAAVGLGVPFANGPIQAVLQATVAPEFQGRVFTLYASLGTVVAPIGLLLAAPVAEMFGVRVWYAAGGLACVSMGVAAIFVPSVAGLGSSAEPTPGESSPSGEVAA
jgi:DHA3 family macrolide efflux protein-like MFS transporter